MYKLLNSDLSSCHVAFHFKIENHLNGRDTITYVFPYKACK